MAGKLRSGLCTQGQLESGAFRGWASRMTMEFKLHRKLWEWCFIAQALHERGKLKPGMKGLGFGVGQEPLTGLFAAEGCQVVATDMDPEGAIQAGWASSHEYAPQFEALNRYQLCDPEKFRERCSFRAVDMNAIPEDLRDFDFTWSSCCFEHLGSIEQGQRFVEEQMECLKPGGVAVHTTEYNLSSDETTLSDGPCVLFRRRDIDWLAAHLRSKGHAVEVDYDPGAGLADGFIDVPPYGDDPHLKLQMAGYVSTSIGLIFEKNTRADGGWLRAIVRKFRPKAA